MAATPRPAPRPGGRHRVAGIRVAGNAAGGERRPEERLAGADGEGRDDAGAVIGTGLTAIGTGVALFAALWKVQGNRFDTLERHIDMRFEAVDERWTSTP